MLIGRHSALALLVGLSLSSVACSQLSGSDEAGESSAAIESVDASSLIAVNPALPFEVKRMHPATGRIFNARWGAHGGPIATLADDTTAMPTVTRWFIPKGINSPAAGQPLPTATVDHLPENTDSFYWNNDGFLDTPDGALMAYAGTGGNFVGELIQYSSDYDAVVSRGFVNGFYSGASVSDTRIVYSGLSGITAAAAPDTAECGLWGSDLSASSIVPGTPSTRLIKWTGASGPVATDANGNVFAAAFITGGAHSESIFALGKNQAHATEAQTAATVTETDNGGTASLAAVSTPGSTTGWVFAKGWDGASPSAVFARPYSATPDGVTAEGAILQDAIKPVLGTNTISMFSDPKGNLWVTVTAEAGAWLIELEPKAQP